MDLSDKVELRWLSAILSDAQDAVPDVDFLLVGAMARDVLLHYGHGVPIARATTDIDFGLTVSSWEDFQQVYDAILDSAHFSSARQSHHLRIHRGGVPLDLIPFGGVERDDGTITWPQDDSVMGVQGYTEARAAAIDILLPDEQSVATVCLPMLVILKLMAWSERHTYAPRKDASDLFLLLANYLNNENMKRMYDVGIHLFDSDDFDYLAAGAWLAGYDATQCIVSYSEQPHSVLAAVEKILSIEADANGQLRLVGEAGDKAAIALKLLAGFRDGINFSPGGRSS